MVNLQKTLESLAANEIAIPEVQVMIQSLLQKRQLSTRELQEALNQAVQQGQISPQQADRLNLAAPDFPDTDGEEDEEVTQIAYPAASSMVADEDEDATQIAYPPSGLDTASGAEEDEEATQIAYPQASATSDDDEDATIIATPPPGATPPAEEEDEDATVIATPPSGHPGQPEESSDDEDEDATVIATPAQDVDTQLTVMAEDQPSSTFSSRTSGSMTSSTYSTTNTSQRSWDLPGASSSQLKKLGPGSIIKDRFILDKVLGAGGMGKVFQARDLLKVEAKDSNPYVAMKVLTEDFKAHPQAFVALQREASRQQKLAHPNIATVYDFDRIGMTGTQVFITMELLVGKPLDTFIRKVVRPKGGLPFEEAFPLIEQLGAALSYAHQRNIVHSDFKPGNAFLCDDGTVKTLDFGIARAVNAGADEQKEKEEEEGNQDDFDAGDLGALTPAYASLEMLQGKDPSTQDDLYALAVVAYELLTGYHPFNKKSALKAQEAKLVPAPIKGLKKRQMKGLIRGLAFEKEDRTATVEKFLEELEGKANWHKNPWVLGTAFSVILGVAAYNPLLSYLDKLHVDRLIERVETQQPEKIEEVITTLPSLEVNARNRITDTTRDILQGYLEELMEAAVKVDEQRYNFDQAENELARMEQLYPDSAAAIGLSNQLELERNRYLHQLNQRLNLALEADNLLPGAERPESISEILSLIIAVDPDHQLLEDPRIPDAYGTAAQEAINLDALQSARTYLDVGLARMPDDIGLINTQDRWELAHREQEKRLNLEHLQETFTTQAAGFDSLDAYLEAKPTLLQLARLSPDNQALYILGDQVTPLLMEADDRELLKEHADLWLALGQAYFLVNQGQAPTSQELTDQISGLLENPEFTQEWEQQIKQSLDWLDVSPGVDNSSRQQQRNRIAAAYEQRSRELESSQRYNLALSILDRADALGLVTPQLQTAESEIQQNYQTFLSEREEAARLARIEGMKNTLLVEADAREMDAAEETLSQLRDYLGDDDPFLTITAADALAEAYLEVTNRLGNDRLYHEAVKMAERGLKVAPNDLQLQNAQENYLVEGNIQDLNQIFAEGTHFDTPAAETQLNQIRTFAPERYTELERQYTNLLVEKILEVADTGTRRQAESLATRASILFPDNSRLARLRADLAPPPWAQGRTARAALSTGRLTEAQGLLQASQERLPEHPEVLDFARDLRGRIQEAEATFARFETQLEEKNFEQARSLLGEARQLWSDNNDYRAAIARLSEEMAAQRWQGQILQRDMDIRSLQASNEITGADVAGQPWEPLQSSRPCTEELASYGRRARAICFDMLHQQVRGPLLVVVPGRAQQPGFAISKYEISNEDYNKYCFLSGQCPVQENQDQDLPRTDLSLQEIEQYLAWLSERTGQTYRLPSRNEWLYAASAQGQQPPRDYNCRVRLGGDILKGDQLNQVSTGHQNGWGLQNFIGNVQELARDDNRLLALGGAYQDPHAECSLDFAREHSGSADGVTGFRLLREEVLPRQLQSAQAETNQ
ncbi:bifunctional serine/threonine-protein kinase/formylglycine-generating enzyme family protein [Marinospirillum perlucidum]|uniref:bifunctional serine/threonine-protein kinase/formylglycine-generating enzyme family protein n=1 Tax=Marinospirillum perlucidum TaxID=1982602 RepID=UPI000DF2B683|nr:bifunctional serine/threonine-protein kinase/formylglycine-generating enzyme family protein [Marinospirillum perlucidum]